MTDSLEKLKAMTELLIEKDRQLNYSEEKYKAIFNGLIMPLFVVSTKDYQVVDANASAIKAFGFSYDELMTKKAYEQSLNPERTRHVIDNKITESEGTFFTKNNSIVKAFCRLSYFTLHGHYFCIIVTHLIDELREGDPCRGRQY